MYKVLNIAVIIFAVLLSISCEQSKQYTRNARESLRSLGYADESATNSDVPAEAPDVEGRMGSFAEESSDMLLVTRNTEALEDDITADEQPEDEEGDSEAESDDSSGSDDESGTGDGDESSGESAQGEQGSRIVPGTGMIPKDWPEDIPLYPDFDVSYCSSDSDGLKILSHGSAGLAEVREFYVRLEGWEVTQESEVEIVISEDSGAESRRQVVILIREAEVLTLDILEDPDDTLVLLLYSRA